MNERTAESSLRPAVLVLALILLTVGVLGFFFLPEDNQAGENTLWIFSATGMLDIIRTGTGVLGLTAMLKPSAIRAYGWIVFVGFAGLTAFGVLSAATTTAGDAVNFGWADNVLHGLASIGALGIALVSTRSAKPAEQAERRA
ncbi:hypothetical protein BS329_09120 [Amycolatopsis coloradensis]|uniref:DUF4383 domain-containing protein n=1 Tax=Amycolatopsis coloradensis TaxID=76021 RepID=A0A1R0KZ88_9PSEU|nr:DUF4383 domain-containing protein [Amycolatopsis coloradensis]OLZ54657.1 hypothetical protein BS329_09120 [Amycolatopsis coloradensis]